MSNYTPVRFPVLGGSEFSPISKKNKDVPSIIVFIIRKKKLENKKARKGGREEGKREGKREGGNQDFFFFLTAFLSANLKHHF